MRLAVAAALVATATAFGPSVPLSARRADLRAAAPAAGRGAATVAVSMSMLGAANGGAYRRKQGRASIVRAEAMSVATPEPDNMDQVLFLGITRREMKKLLPLGAMFFCILFNYTILRDTKDVLVVTAPKSGAEIIPFLKTYVNLPGAVLFTIAFSSMNNRMSPNAVFYSCLGPFLAFFGLFATTIYPNIGVLHPHLFADKMAAFLPSGFAAPIAIFRNWSFSLFYLAAELWGSVVVSVLFWGLANRVMTVQEAEKYYPLFGLGANVALIFSGQYVKWVSTLRSNLPAGVDPWGFSLRYLMGAVVASGGVIALLYKHIAENCISAAAKKKAKVKTKLTLGESAAYLGKSTYIRDMAMLVIGYGMSINLVEVTWKARLKQQFTDPNAYSAFMGNFSSATGAVTFTMMILGRFIFKRFGWGVAAAITPLMLLSTGAVFFSQVIFPGAWAPLAVRLGTTPLMLAVLVGAAQNILSKSAKYSLFDPCKEMAYIPLDAESKTKGKAAVDVIGNPLGKSGGSFVQQFLIFAFGSLGAATPALGGFLLITIGGWLKAAKSLNGQFNEKMAELAADEAAEADADNALPSV